MCSQYEIKTDLANIATKANAKIMTLPTPIIKEHVYPYDNSWVVIRQGIDNLICQMSYSLIPSWSNTRRPKWSTYNARLDRPKAGSSTLEYIFEVPTWRESFQSRRCLVPLTAFFESCSGGTLGRSWVKFSQLNHDLLFAAGLWSSWVDMQTGEVVDSFAIITDDPDHFLVEAGHDRQPVFLTIDNAQHWLDCESLDASRAYSFLKSNQQSLEYSVEVIRQIKANVNDVKSEYDLFSIL